MIDLPRARGPAVVNELGAIAWDERAHAYGRGRGKRGATNDLQKGLTAAFSNDEAAHDDARDVLFGTLLHQGTTYEATCDAVPFVIAYLVDVDDGPWTKELWLWLGNVAISATLPAAPTASHEGAWGPGVRDVLLASFRASLAVMRPRVGSCFVVFADALAEHTRHDAPTDAARASAWRLALKQLFEQSVPNGSR